MTLRRSQALLTATQNTGLRDAFGAAAAGTGRIDVLTGAQTATADAVETGTLLSTNTMNTTTWPSATAGSAGATAGVALTANSITSATAVASGTAGWMRMRLNADTPPGTLNNTSNRIDFAIGSDATIDNSAIVSGGTVNVTALSITEPYQ